MEEATMLTSEEHDVDQEKPCDVEYQETVLKRSALLRKRKQSNLLILHHLRILN